MASTSANKIPSELSVIGKDTFHLVGFDVKVQPHFRAAGNAKSCIGLKKLQRKTPPRSRYIA